MPFGKIQILHTYYCFLPNAHDEITRITFLLEETEEQRVERTVKLFETAT